MADACAAACAAPDRAPPAIVAAAPFFTPPIRPATSPLFAHGPCPVVADTTAAPGTTVHATPFAAFCTSLLPATAFAFFIRPPNLPAFFGAAESATVESEGVCVAASPGAATIATSNSVSELRCVRDMAAPLAT